MVDINEFNQILASSLTPITLISGVGLLMICMTARYNHATNRIRQLMAKRATAAAKFEPVIDAEIDLIYERASLVRRGMLCVALSAVFSALLVTLCVLADFTDVSLLYVEGGLLMGAITLIVVSTLYFSAEVNLSLHALKMAIDNMPPAPEGPAGQTEKTE